jgi:predicted GNAT family acetyltransferase
MNIIHDPNRQIFFVDINGEICKLGYRKIDHQTLDYRSTFTPNALRGQGIAGKITAVALEYAQKNNYLIIPSCPYIKNYIETHPEYSGLVKKN